MKKVLLLSAVLIGGCAQQQPTDLQDFRLPPPGVYSGGEQWFHMEMMSAMDRDADFGKISPAVRRDLADCVWLKIKAGLIPSELSDLDQFAKGEAPISPETKGALYRQLDPQTTSHDLAALQPYCPDKIAEFQEAVKQ